MLFCTPVIQGCICEVAVVESCHLTLLHQQPGKTSVFQELCALPGALAVHPPRSTSQAAPTEHAHVASKNSPTGTPQAALHTLYDTQSDIQWTLTQRFSGDEVHVRLLIRQGKKTGSTAQARPLPLHRHGMHRGTMDPPASMS